MVPIHLKFPTWLIAKEKRDHDACLYTLQKQVHLSTCWKANYIRQIFDRVLLMYFTLANVV